MSQPTNTTIPTEDLRALFDVAVHSMDFGSGFLDTDEVNMLRRIAVLIGVDPIKATPSTFTRQYKHAFSVWRSANNVPAETCGACSLLANADVHQP